jgi:isoprenylcysteine carboxyl methyltransferase (ICMT) family protein YpbQ
MVLLGKRKTQIKNSVITIPEKGILFAIAKSRVAVCHIFALVVLLLLLFTGHSFSQESLTDVLFEVAGLFLLSICSLGRLWALMYISGNKRGELITKGPYSIVRHPLYVLSLIGALGIGLASENLLILALISLFYLFYYPFTILAEEKSSQISSAKPILTIWHVRPDLFRNSHFIKNLKPIRLKPPVSFGTLWMECGLYGYLSLCTLLTRCNTRDSYL